MIVKSIKVKRSSNIKVPRNLFSPSNRRASLAMTIPKPPILSSLSSSDGVLAIQQRELLLQEWSNDTGNDNNDEKRIQLTPFQRKVYTALCYVPEGYVTTYQHIAQYINCYSNQAIGQALKRNPYCPIIPCHRVIKTDGTIGGFHGKISGEYIHKKIQMLQEEGVSFIADGKVNPKCIYDYSDVPKENKLSSSPPATNRKRKIVTS